MGSKQSGFTLIEIAIVLVIIGLLLGGVLKGQELINSAKIKNIANDLNGVTAALYSYQDRYKAYPGDDANARARWTITAANPTTAGNGQVEGEFNADADASESRLFWLHLRKAGLIGGDSASGAQAQNAVGGVLGVQTNAGPSGTGVTPVLSGLVVCTSNLSGKLAEALDSQLDDGKADAGSMRAFDQEGVVTTSSAGPDGNPAREAASTAFVDDGVKLYTVCKAV